MGMWSIWCPSYLYWSILLVRVVNLSGLWREGEYIISGQFMGGGGDMVSGVQIV
jgi:hypothetical protein